MKKIKYYDCYPDRTLKFYVDFETMELKCNCPDDFYGLYEMEIDNKELIIYQLNNE